MAEKATETIGIEYRIAWYVTRLIADQRCPQLCDFCLLHD